MRRSALNSRVAAVVFVIGFSTGHDAPKAAESCLSYCPTAVSLPGTVRIAKAYGPPGYGEDPKHDAKEDYPQLVLDKPVCVTGNLDDDPEAEGEQDVRNIQLVFPARPFDHALLGKPVMATGKLFHQVTGHHHTRILMTVDSIR